MAENEFRKIVINTVLSLFLTVFAVILIVFFARDFIVEQSKMIIGTMGAAGIFAGVYLSDALPAFIPPDMFLMLSIAAGMNDFYVIAVCFGASLMGGSTAFSAGKYITPVIPQLNLLKLRMEEKWSEYIIKYGKKAVVVAALTPVPYSWMAFTAGSFNMRYADFIEASIFRLVRFAVYYYAIKLGWVGTSEII